LLHNYRDRIRYQWLATIKSVALETELETIIWRFKAKNFSVAISVTIDTELETDN
jgi:hypothetical protein